jgi:hypothetical protein
LVKKPALREVKREVPAVDPALGDCRERFSKTRSEPDGSCPAQELAVDFRLRPATPGDPSMEIVGPWKIDQRCEDMDTEVVQIDGRQMIDEYPSAEIGVELLASQEIWRRAVQNSRGNVLWCC